MTVKNSNRLVVLDGLRGVAALCVMLFHCTPWLGAVAPRGGALSVDLFFVVSGYVIAHSYGEDLLERRVSLARFMMLRIIRLYPLYIIGVLLGTFPILLSIISSGTISGPARAGLLSAPFSLFMIPSPLTANLYPLDLAFWSIFFELLANAVFALCVGWATTRNMLLCMGAAAVMIFMSRDKIGVGGGWDTFWVCLGRVTYSFAAGVLVHRLAGTLKTGRRIPAWGILAVFLVCAWSPAALWLPIVLVVFPACVWLGAGAIASDRLAAAMSVAGLASYGLYAIHGPLISIIAIAVARTHASPPGPLLALSAVTAALIAALLLNRVYDAPVRRAALRRFAAPRARHGQISTAHGTPP